MADVTITATDVELVDANASLQAVTAGVNLTAGQVVYKNPDTGKYELAFCTDATATKAKGIVVIGADADRCAYIVSTEGLVIDIGGTVAVGEIYVVSDTAGGIKPESDLSSGEHITLLALGVSTTTIQLLVVNTGIDK